LRHFLGDVIAAAVSPTDQRSKNISRPV